MGHTLDKDSKKDKIQKLQKTQNDKLKDIITYCQFPQNESEKITITSKDYQCLESSEFLNDVIIDFYLKARQKSNQDIEKKAHIFSTFFYERLSFHLSKDNNVDGYDRVKKWTKKVNIFEKDFIVVPVNEKLHWYLCIICYANRENKEPDDAFKKSCILIFDSLPNANDTRSETCKNLRAYLTKEWAAKYPDKPGKIFSDVNLPQINPKVLLQNNSKDCGVFLLQYFESFFEVGLKRAWSDVTISHLDLFLRTKVDSKRSDIAMTIRALTKAQKKDDQKEPTFPTLNFKSLASPKKIADEIHLNPLFEREDDLLIDDKDENEESKHIIEEIVKSSENTLKYDGNCIKNVSKSIRQHIFQIDQWGWDAANHNAPVSKKPKISLNLN